MNMREHQYLSHVGHVGEIILNYFINVAEEHMLAVKRSCLSSFLERKVSQITKAQRMRIQMT